MGYVADELLHGQHRRVGRARSLAMKIRDSVAFVTGANRGLGLVFAQELLAADAIKIVDPTQATGKSKELLTALQNNIKSVPNLAKALANSPAALKALMEFDSALDKGNLNATLGHEIAMALRQTNRCGYFLSLHTSIAKVP